MIANLSGFWALDPIPKRAQIHLAADLEQESQIRQVRSENLVFQKRTSRKDQLPSMTTTITKNRRPKGSAQIRKEKRAAGEFWGYDVWIRQADGTRKRYREFTFATKTDAELALAALRTSGSRTRYGLVIASVTRSTTVKEAIASFAQRAKVNLLANRTDERSYWRDVPGYLHTLQRWAEFTGVNRAVSSIRYEDFVRWVAAEIERAKKKGKTLKTATIRRGLKTIRATLNHAARTFPDLQTYRVPGNPLAKNSEQERDRVLSDEEISKISRALSDKAEWADALLFFQLSLITGGTVAELLRMRPEESSERFGTVKLYSSRTKKWRTMKAPAAASLIEQRKREALGNEGIVLTCPDHWIREVFREASESISIPYGQNVEGGWCPNDLRHTNLANLALAGVGLNLIKEYAGHASIVETRRYLKYSLQSPGYCQLKAGSGKMATICSTQKGAVPNMK